MAMENNYSWQKTSEDRYTLIRQDGKICNRVFRIKSEDSWACGIGGEWTTLEAAQSAALEAVPFWMNAPALDFNRSGDIGMETKQ